MGISIYARPWGSSAQRELFNPGDYKFFEGFVADVRAKFPGDNNPKIEMVLDSDTVEEDKMFESDPKLIWETGYAQLSDDDQEVFRLYWAHTHEPLGKWTWKTVKSKYLGYYVDLEDFALDQANQDHPPETFDNWPFNCVDWERAGRDLVASGDYFEIDDHYFLRW